MVIGLGTGSTAGWLAAVPSIERVDVVEIEPAVVEVARACAPVNHDVLESPKTRLFFADAREVLLTAPDLYDVIFSEPSNPFRAGIASLFTRELYRAAAERLEDDGIFVQWLQAYEVDQLTVQTILVTLQSVFAHVEIWRTLPEDLLLVASKQPLAHDAETLRRRLGEEPYRAAMLAAWRSEGLEGLLAHFVAGPELARRLLADEIAGINTDDHNHVEFGFARTLGPRSRLAVEPLLAVAAKLGVDRPAGLDTAVDWERVEDARLSFSTCHGSVPPSDPRAPPERAVRAGAHRLYTLGEPEPAALAWLSQTKLAESPVELVLLAHGLALRGDAGAEDWIDRLRAFRPTEAEILLARLRLAQDRIEEAAVHVERATTAMRETPWTWDRIAFEAPVIALEIAQREGALAPRMSAALAEPFSVYQVDEHRRLIRVSIATLYSEEEAARLLEDFEPWVRWDDRFLGERVKLYTATDHPLAAKAQAQLATYSRYATTAADAP
jgi:hypothetical protein